MARLLPIVSHHNIERDTIRNNSGWLFVSSEYFKIVICSLYLSIKYPLWEFLKTRMAKVSNKNKCEPYQSAICGSIAGKKIGSLLEVKKQYAQKLLYIFFTLRWGSGCTYNSFRCDQNTNSTITSKLRKIYRVKQSNSDIK